MRNVLSIITTLFATLTFTGVLPACGGSDDGDPNEGEGEAEGEEGEAEAEGEIVPRIWGTFTYEGETVLEFDYRNDKTCPPCDEDCRSGKDNCHGCEVGQRECMTWNLGRISIGARNRTARETEVIGISTSCARDYNGSGSYEISRAKIRMGVMPDYAGYSVCTSCSGSPCFGEDEPPAGTNTIVVTEGGGLIRTVFHAEQLCRLTWGAETCEGPATGVLDGQAIIRRE